MSSSWKERQGQVGDLKCKSKEELYEILSRQEKLLANKRFLRGLPDKGKKILDFGERVRLAVSYHEEEERKQSLLSSARTELQSKYQQAFTARVQDTPQSSHRTADDDAVHDVSSPNSTTHQDRLACGEPAVVTMETDAAGETLNPDKTKESELATALEMVKLSETCSSAPGRQSRDTLPNTAADNVFLGGQPMTKSHYLDVLERHDRSPAPRKQKFMPNHLPTKDDSNLSGSSSPARSSPLSAQARRERDMKHLDDITSAKLAPLHYSPIQLLSLEESAVLHKEQTKTQQELQARMAAQKLSDGLRVSMGTYAPDGGPMAAYREVHDDGAQLSSEED